MKKEYIELFEGIEPDEKIKNKVLDKAANNSKIPFSPKKFIAVAAVFALILSVGFGVYRSSSVNAVNDDGTSQQTAQSSLDFSIVAYAKENENGVNVIGDDDVTLTNIKITLNEEADGYSISAESSDDGLSVRSDEDIEAVIFECENGSFTYIDRPLRNYLISQNKYYSVVIPITEDQFNEFNSAMEESGGRGTADIKEEFVKNLLSSKDCSQYIYDDDFDASKISENEYSVYASDMAGADEKYYDYCMLITNRNNTVSTLQDNTNTVTAKTYQPGDEIGNVHYYPEYATEYLLNNPDVDFSELPTDNIKITVKFKNGQSAVKEIITQFNSDGVLTMKCK